MEESNKTLSFDTVMKDLGISEEEISDVEDIDIEWYGG